jgi:hypothetical protein
MRALIAHAATAAATVALSARRRHRSPSNDCPTVRTITHFTHHHRLQCSRRGAARPRRDAPLQRPCSAGMRAVAPSTAATQCATAHHTSNDSARCECIVRDRSFLILKMVSLGSVPYTGASRCGGRLRCGTNGALTVALLSTLSVCVSLFVGAFAGNAGRCVCRSIAGVFYAVYQRDRAALQSASRRVGGLSDALCERQSGHSLLHLAVYVDSPLPLIDTILEHGGRMTRALETATCASRLARAAPVNGAANALVRSAAADGDGDGDGGGSDDDENDALPHAQRSYNEAYIACVRNNADLLRLLQRYHEPAEWIEAINILQVSLLRGCVCVCAATLVPLR